MKILIDAGHNSKNFDTGCVGKISKEQDLTFEIASALYKILRKNGYDAHLTRRTKDEILGTGTVNSSLAKRAEICNAINPDLFLSIHINSGGGTGCEAYVYEKGGASFDFAQKCVAEMQKIGRVSRGVKSAPFYVLKNTNAPAVLFEAGFIDNTAEEKWLCENTYAVANALYGAVCQKTDYPTATEAVAILQKCQIISDAEKWYNGTWNDADFKWLLRKTASYIDKARKR